MNRALGMLLFFRMIGIELLPWQRRMYIAALIEGYDTVAHGIVFPPRGRRRR